jgi:5-methylthioadenosine/S-adenosylhomocysteine deaminase
LDEGFRYTRHLIETWKNHPLVSVAVEPHATFTCSPGLLKKAHELALEYDVPMVIHLSETLSEVEEIKKRYGMRPAEFLDSIGVLYPGLLAIHCVHLDEDEMKLLSKKQVKVVSVPESNLKLGSGIAPVAQMIHEGMTVALGTDGSASNNNLDMFSEMDTASKVEKIRCMDPTRMDAKTVVRMTTIDGAKALGIDQITGSIEPGKKADIIILDLNKPHLTPMYNPYSHIVYTAAGSDVIHSIINGKIVMENRNLLSINLEDIIERANQESKRVRKWIYNF